jgi:hypothetical protein
MRTFRHLRRSIERLPPYPSLLLLAVPLAIVEPLKLAAVFVLGDGHWITGGLVMICAYAMSLFVTHRLFIIVKPKLLTLPWFAASWEKFMALRGKVLASLPTWLSASRLLRRKALWMWDDAR